MLTYSERIVVVLQRVGGDGDVGHVAAEVGELDGGEIIIFIDLQIT